jgi:hypothetical protein
MVHVIVVWWMCVQVFVCLVIVDIIVPGIMLCMCLLAPGLFVFLMSVSDCGSSLNLGCRAQPGACAARCGTNMRQQSKASYRVHQPVQEP